MAHIADSTIYDAAADKFTPEMTSLLAEHNYTIMRLTFPEYARLQWTLRAAAGLEPKDGANALAGATAEMLWRSITPKFRLGGSKHTTLEDVRSSFEGDANCVKLALGSHGGDWIIAVSDRVVRLLAACDLLVTDDAVLPAVAGFKAATETIYDEHEWPSAERARDEANAYEALLAGRTQDFRLADKLAELRR